MIATRLTFANFLFQRRRVTEMLSRVQRIVTKFEKSKQVKLKLLVIREIDHSVSAAQ